MARGYKYFEAIEKNAVLLGVLTLVAVSFGGLSEITPLFIQAHAVGPPPGVKPYDALRLAGKDIYVREGCYLCHSQMIRALRAETQRYGHYSVEAESVYDRPFQWGSKRTGPDLARVGGRYSNEWHVQHLSNPRAVVPESIMPSYAFLREHEVNVKDVGMDLKANVDVGVPYSGDMITNAEADMKAQADPNADTTALLERYPKAKVGDFDGDPSKLTEMDALVAYLQMLGTLVDFSTYDDATGYR